MDYELRKCTRIIRKDPSTVFQSVKICESASFNNRQYIVLFRTLALSKSC